MRSSRKRHCRKIESNNQFVGREICVPLRRDSGQAMKIGNRYLTVALRSSNTDDRVEDSERNAHVAGMRGNALFALAENCMNTIVAFECAAAAAGFAFVACWKRWVIKIIAARALQDIAAHRCHIAQLRARSGKQRFTQNGITCFYQFMFRNVGIAWQRADPHAFVWKLLNLCKWESSDV